MNEKERAEANELARLLADGYAFSVTRLESKPHKKALFGRYFASKRQEAVTYHYKIEEPTLGTLDRLSKEWLALEVDNNALQGADVMTHARTMVANHSERMARIIALAVLGSRYKVKQEGGGYRYDEKGLQEITEVLMDSLKPSDLLQLVLSLQAMTNLGDFIYSTRLLSLQRTTAPTRVEQGDYKAPTGGVVQ